jgi:hypothetical protein
MEILAVISSTFAGTCLFCAMIINSWNNKRKCIITFIICATVSSTIVCVMFAIILL